MQAARDTNHIPDGEAPRSERRTMLSTAPHDVHELGMHRSTIKFSLCSPIENVECKSTPRFRDSRMVRARQIGFERRLTAPVTHIHDMSSLVKRKGITQSAKRKRALNASMICVFRVFHTPWWLYREQEMVRVFNKTVTFHDKQLRGAVCKLTKDQMDRIVRLNHDNFRYEKSIKCHNSVLVALVLQVHVGFGTTGRTPRERRELRVTVL